MIIEFLLSLLVLCITSVMCSLTSGGRVVELIEPVLLPGILVILGMMIFLSGYGKSFVGLFSSSKKIEEMELKKWKSRLIFHLRHWFLFHAFLCLSAQFIFT